MTTSLASQMSNQVTGRETVRIIDRITVLATSQVMDRRCDQVTALIIDRITVLTTDMTVQGYILVTGIS